MLAALKKEYGEVDWVSLSILIGLVGEIVSIIVLTTVSAGLEVGFGLEFAKTMMLFTAFSMVHAVFSYMSLHLKPNGIHLYAQGLSGSKHKLVESFKSQADSSVILGTDSFWE